MDDREQVHARASRRPVPERARSRFHAVDLDERTRSGTPVPRSRRSAWVRRTPVRGVRGRSGGGPRD